MKMSELSEKLCSNLEEYKDKNIVIAKNPLRGNNGELTYNPVDFKIFYDKRNDTIILIENIF
jgi:hypothetical protein